MSSSGEIKNFFFQRLRDIGEEGDIGFTSFRIVYEELMPIQQAKLRGLVGDRLELLMDEGSMVCLGVAFRDPVMEFIDSRTDAGVDYGLWNRYALEYHRLNQVLNELASDIASKFDGIPLKATIGGLVDQVEHVREYFGMVISHRVVAEQSGIGWRGKNQLMIHKRFSCAIRFATVIVPYLLEWNERSEPSCGSCTACEEVCTFIKNRERLPDYRENCRRYILFLKSKGIEKDICGKCIKACYQSSIFRDKFSLPL